MRIALAGANGYIGSKLAKYLMQKNQEIFCLTRSNFFNYYNVKFDIFINSAMPSKRFWAENNPELDFNESVIKTNHFLNYFNYKQFVQISTLSVCSGLDTFYGRHRLASEKLVDNGVNLIVRLGATYDESLRKGIIYDLMNGNEIFENPKSTYNFAPLNFVAEKIVKCILDQKKTLFEIEGKDSISIESIIDKLKLKVRFAEKLKRVENQTANRFHYIIDYSYPGFDELINFMRQNTKKDLIHAC